MKHRHNHHSFESQELEKKRKEFQVLERRLARLRHELDDLLCDVADFEKLYSERMSCRIAELRSLENEIGRLSNGSANEQGARYSERQQRWDPPPEVSETLSYPEPQVRQRETLKDIYRRVAKTIHPDLARHEDERKNRQKLMAEANRAYAEEDYVTLLSILNDWGGKDGVSPSDRTSPLLVLERRLGLLNQEIRSVESQIFRLKDSDFYRLVEKFRQGKRLGQEMLSEVAVRVDADILTACRRLNDVRRRGEAQDLPAGLRCVSFLSDRPLGLVYVRNRLSRNFLDWRKLGQAVGSVVVPTGTALRLDVEKGRASDLDTIPGLSPEELQGCYLYGATDADLCHILRFHGIEELYLSGPGVTGEGMIHLLELPNVERLYLYDTQIGDEGLVYLKYLNRLRYVTFCNGRVTDAGLTRLRDLLPSCTVINLPGVRVH